MSKAVNSLPSHLLAYIDEQRWGDYTPRDHAVWRFIMKQNIRFFGDSGFAVPEYLKGIVATGISKYQIPKIVEMDQCLEKFGWGAVPVCGFIPPIAFLEFQSYGVLPIATHMRRVEHIGYTPAPDIVHESAGHAPILVNEIFSIFLKKYANIAKKSINSKHNVDLYEAVRYLSDIKELDGISDAEIRQAEEKITELKSKKKVVGEVAEAVRLYWWTAEYGLLGDLDQPKVYGAGLLSSIGESQRCLSKDVKKIPLSIDCIKFDYDITEPQPQLFVANKFDDLINTLDDLDAKMAYRVGGSESILKAIEAESVVTVKWSENSFVSSVVKKLTKLKENAGLLYFGEMIQYGCAHEVIEPRACLENFVVPFGVAKYLQGDVVKNTDTLRLGVKTAIRYSDDLSIHGELMKLDVQKGYLLLKDATVFLGDRLICELASYFLPLGEKIISIEGGPRDIKSYRDYYEGQATTTPMGSVVRRKSEVQQSYKRVATCRFDENSVECCNLGSFIEVSKVKHPKEWLLFLEIYELILMKSKKEIALQPYLAHVCEHIGVMISTLDDESASWLQKGYRLLQDEYFRKG